MKIKTWLIHKLGGLNKQDILPPPQYNVINPKVEKFSTQVIDKDHIFPEDYIIDRLIYNLIPLLKDKIKITKEENHHGETCYRAEVNIIDSNQIPY